MKNCLLVVIMFLLNASFYAHADYCPDLGCTIEGTKKNIEAFEKKYGVKYTEDLYGPTNKTNVEFDIVHQDGTKEHCYQTMKDFPVHCR